MTLEEAHKKIDEEYERISGKIRIGTREGMIPKSVAVFATLSNVAEIAREEASYFSLPRKESEDDE